MIGLSRDLRGIAFAFNTKISYMMFFDWIYPAYTPILHRAVEIWYNDPQVINKSGRIKVQRTFPLPGISLDSMINLHFR